MSAFKKTFGDLVEEIERKENLISGKVQIQVESDLKDSLLGATYGFGSAIEEGNYEVFIKYGTGGETADGATMEVEAKGLYHLGLASPKDQICVPRVWRAGQTDKGTGYIILDYLKFTGKSAECASKLGSGLASIHKNSHNNHPSWGFPKDGQCGAFAQLNNTEMREMSWIEFWREFRLGPQIEGIKRSYPNQRKIIELGNQLSSRLDELFSMFPVEDIPRSCLHGDLWSGNWDGVSKNEERLAALFDPACYYGHSEADLGIAHMFGMPDSFFSAYFKQIPKQPGYEKRKLLYELHHHLNHINIFGTGYAHGAIRLLQDLTK